jgi:PAS domain S-box-containing protein
MSDAAAASAPERRADDWRLIIDAVPAALLAVDQTGCIVVANRAAERIFGYAGAELLGQPIEMLLPERFRGPHVGLRAGYMAAPEPRPMARRPELTGRHKDGSEFPIEVELSPVGDAASGIVLAFVVDATSRKRA